MQTLIKKLADVWGPSGYEHRIRAVIREEVAPYADEITVDGLGNLICRVGSGGTKIMVAAHMDVIGLMANYREPTSGYLRFDALGGILPTTLLGSRVEFEDGTIGTVGVHDQWGAARTRALELSQFFIDASDGENDDFPAGQPVSFYAPVEVRGKRVFGRGLDDRAGCAVAVQAMKQLNKQTENEVYFVFTVQEEVGVRGAKAAAVGVAPDVGIAVDVTATGDTPQNLKMAVKLGAGPAIKIKDNSLVVPPLVRDWMVNTADSAGLPYQLELLPMGGTDAGAIHTSLSGVPSGVLSIPCRYVHTPGETVDLDDMQASADLLAALVANPVPSLVAV